MQEVSNTSPGLVTVFLRQMLNEHQLTDLLNEADMNQCWLLVVTPHNPELRDFAWGFGGDLDFILVGQASDSLEEDLSRWCQESHVPKAFDDSLTIGFGERLKRHSETAFLDKYSRTCFVELQEDEESGREFPDEVDGVPPQGRKGTSGIARSCKTIGMSEL